MVFTLSLVHFPSYLSIVVEFLWACRVWGFLEVIWGWCCGHVVSNLKVIMNDFHVTTSGHHGQLALPWTSDSPLCHHDNTERVISINPEVKSHVIWSAVQNMPTGDYWKVDTSTLSDIKSPPTSSLSSLSRGKIVLQKKQRTNRYKDSLIPAAIRLICSLLHYSSEFYSVSFCVFLFNVFLFNVFCLFNKHMTKLISPWLDNNVNLM